MSDGFDNVAKSACTGVEGMDAWSQLAVSRVGGEKDKIGTADYHVKKHSCEWVEQQWELQGQVTDVRAPWSLINRET